MVKSPRIRHSKSRREPVTIDLDASEVQREPGESPAKPAPAPDSGAAPEQRFDEVSKPNAADEALADKDVAERDASAAATEAAPSPTDEQPGPSDEQSRYGEAPAYGRDATPPPAAPARRGMSVLAAGIFGAVLALLGAGALQWSGLMPSPRVESIVDDADLDAIRAEIERLKGEAAADGQADPAVAESLADAATRMDALTAELDQLRTELAAVQAAGGGNSDPAALQALTDRVAQAEAAATTAGERMAALDANDQQLAALQEAQRIAGENVTALTGRIDQIEQRLAELTTRLEQQAAEPRMALAVAAAGLKSAIDRGTPFMMELETYAAVAPDMPQIAALRDMAASGVPTRAEIEAEAAEAAGRMVAAARPVDENAGFLDRLMSSAQSLVEVRPIGAVEGEGVGATVARMEVALRDGDYAKAVEEYETLPPAAKEAGAEFIARVKARMTADRLIAEALAGASARHDSEG